MNPNGLPFQSPYGAPPPPPAGSARQSLNVPAILLMVFGALTVLTNLASFLKSLSRDSAAELADLVNQLRPLMQQLNVPESSWMPALKAMTGGGGTALSVVATVLVLVMTFGAWQMRQLKMYPLAFAACLIALNPIGPCCCCLTLPVGVWGLVLLLRPEVRAQFT